MKKIYAASKTKHAQMWRQLRLKYPIISTWIDEAGQGDTTDRSELARRCIAEVVECDFVVLYCEQDETMKGAFIEVGAALALNKEVRFIGKPENYPKVNSVFAEHPLWRNCKTLNEALTL